jgi:hypothetical protein
VLAQLDVITLVRDSFCRLPVLFIEDAKARVYRVQKYRALVLLSRLRGSDPSEYQVLNLRTLSMGSGKVYLCMNLGFA